MQVPRPSNYPQRLCFTVVLPIFAPSFQYFYILLPFCFCWFRRQFLGSSSYNWLCQCYRRWGSNCWIKTEPISLQGESGDIEAIRWERHAKTQTYWSPNCEKKTQKNLWISLEGLLEVKLCHALCITWFLFPLNWKSGYPQLLRSRETYSISRQLGSFLLCNWHLLGYLLRNPSCSDTDTTKPYYPLVIQHSYGKSILNGGFVGKMISY